jgi:hypothetical protein
MPDYGKGKIYTIRCRTNDTLIYVGSTIQSLSKRWGGHKDHSKEEKRKNMLIYRTINNDWNNWFIELYELYPCSCKAELCRREGEIIRLIANLNVKIEGRTQKEYYEDHKEQVKEYHKEWYEENKEKRLEQGKEWYDANKEKKAKSGHAYYLRKKLEKQQQTQQ